MANKQNNKTITTETPQKTETFWHKSWFYVKLVLVTALIWAIYFSGLSTETSAVMAVASLIQSLNMLFGFGTPLVILYLIYRHNHKE